jgi:hypothetical protein
MATDKWVIRQARQDVEDAKRALALAKETKSKIAMQDARDELDKKQTVLDQLTSGNENQAGKASERWLSDQYASLGPMVADLVAQDKELAQLFRTAVQEEWDEARFNYELKNNTKWWQSKSAPWQQAFQLEFGSSNAEWKRQLNLAGAAVDNMASSYGVTLDKTERARLARMYHYQGWASDQALMQSQFAKMAERKPMTEFNDVTQLANELAGFAKDFGISYDDVWLKNTAIKLMNPRSGLSLNQVVQQMASSAESRYPGFKGKLGYGAAGGNADGDFTSLRDAAADYVGIASQLLEVQSKDIDLSDGLFRQAFNAGEGGNNKMMSLYDFENLVREDPRWAQTKNAEDATFANLNKVLSVFGFTG